MRYVPNLIPDNSKVLPDYFKGNIYNTTKKKPLRDAILWIISVFFLITALVFISHPIITLIFGLIGFILIPPGHLFLERKLKFKLTSKIKAIATSVLYISSVPLVNHYIDVEQKIAYEQKRTDEKTAKEKEIADQKEQQRKDSLAFYIGQSNHLAQENKIDEANKQLQYAMTFASLPLEKEQIEKERISIATTKVFDLVKAGKYQKALPEINDLLSLDPSNSELRFNRAICYSKTGKIQEAVSDLKSFVRSGNSEAEKLYDRINPIKKRVAYYVTRCWDGSTSSAKGRGACSHHGGVKNWNEPVYEEYRKYE